MEKRPVVKKEVTTTSNIVPALIGLTIMPPYTIKQELETLGILGREWAVTPGLDPIADEIWRAAGAYSA